MAAWITAHYRHPVHDDLPWHIYRKGNAGKRDRELAEGDFVLFYETRTPEGTDVATRELNGVSTPGLPLRPGASGIIHGGYIVGPTRQRTPADLVYDYGNLRAWQYVTPCEVTMSGNIAYRAMCDAIGRRVPANQLGLFPIDLDIYRRLERQLRLIER